MPKKWVLNASPIISLCNIEKASLLIELCDELLIPKGVVEEINRGTEDDSAKIWLQQFGGSYIKDVGPIEAVIRAWALKILNSDDTFIPKTVLLETEWVLRHAFEIDRSKIIKGFKKLLGLPNVNVEDPDSIYQAISWYENKFDFADAFHLASSSRCKSFATFDSSLIKKAQQISSMEMVKL